MKNNLLVTLTFHRLNFNQRWAALKAKLNQIKTFNDKLRLAAFLLFDFQVHKNGCWSYKNGFFNQKLKKPEI